MVAPSANRTGSVAAAGRGVAVAPSLVPSTVRAIAELVYKKGVGDAAQTRSLVTDARSDEPPVPGALAVFSGEHPLLAAIPLERGQAVLGRDETLGITDDRVSRQHAVVTLERGHWKIRDEGSRNGTFVNGTKVEGSAAVESPRVVRLAYSIYLLCDD